VDTYHDLERQLLKKCSKILLNPEMAAFIERLISSALLAADSREAVREALRIEPGLLQLNSETRIRVVAIGKAALNMTTGAIDILGNKILDGLVITKTIPDEADFHFPAKYKIRCGGHPIPTEESILSGQELKHYLLRGTPEDLILMLISGGGSSLVQVPMDSIQLVHLQKMTQALLRCGATIDEINTVRTHLDLVKGGGFLRLAAPARVTSLIVSDVKGDRMDIIASGMTVKDRSTEADALKVLERYGLMSETPSSIVEVLQKGIKRQFQEMDKAKNRSPSNVRNTVILNNASAIDGVMRVAQQAGWQVENLGWILKGEAEDIGRNLTGYLTRVVQDGLRENPICLVGGGETTVLVNGKGIGGRNLEVALGAVPGLVGLTNVALITLATDGEDGQTGFAGAVVTENTLRIANQVGLSVQEYLDQNNSCQFFEAVGGLIETGSTGTNVNDLVMLLAW